MGACIDFYKQKILWMNFDSNHMSQNTGIILHEYVSYRSLPVEDTQRWDIYAQEKLGRIHDLVCSSDMKVVINNEYKLCSNRKIEWQ